ncbi:hypothetical protein LVW35_14875 [Pseudomonas sp. HN11]|uniref:dermonecrotic toxin domain-containing protein n=1 Tax=Pseudomonas sp. HN11 TaxID=1344094 RepID=UPI001F30D43D|nr:DUF6543 domain-containing protein [Pseudomonas sp. HN11]UII68984.1 hypothetical protein LVW35_14875 [Pseudomonas sp. HN11]
MTTLQSSSIPASNRLNAPTPITGKPEWESESSDYTLKTTENKFTDAKARDIKSGTLNVETEKLVDAVLFPGKTGLPKVQVRTFAVDGIQSKDMIFVERVPAESNRPNIVLFMPQQEGNSFISFDNKEQMNTWLKGVATNPNQWEKFSAHFAEGGGPIRDQRIKDVMTRYVNDDVNAIVGPYMHVQGNIFDQLDKEINSPPAPVNGLTDLQEVKETETGRTLYSGQRPDGEKVLYEYDAYGNLLGEGNKGNFYFLQNGINSSRPLTPMSQKEYAIALEREISKNVGADDLRGLFDELVDHLEHPFQGIGEALNALGISKSAADTIERYLDNPFSALLLDLNKNNQIGKVFGVDKATMDGVLKGVGDVAQGFVPYYGQARMLGGLLAKAIRNEPLSTQETRDLGDGLGLKPHSPARKNILPQTSEIRPGPIRPKFEEKPVDEKPVLSTPENEYSVQMGGPMNNLNVMGEEVHTYTDTYKQGNRLNIVAHGVKRGFFDKVLGRPSKAIINNKEYTALEFVNYLKAKGVDPADPKFDSVRLLICYSADGGENSFAREFQQAVGKPVKAYEGTVTVTHGSTNLENVRQMLIKEIKGVLPNLSDQDVDTIATQKTQGLFKQKVQRVEKADGTYIQLKRSNQNGVPEVVMQKISYRPVVFSR